MRGEGREENALRPFERTRAAPSTPGLALTLNPRRTEMPDLPPIAHELGDLGREEADLTHRLIAIHKRRCELLKQLGDYHVQRGDLDGATMQAAAQKKPPPNP